MKLTCRLAVSLAAVVWPLALASAASAAQSALVGKLQQDGTIRLYTNRFQDHFADGTPVAKIDTTRTNGIVSIQRRSADGCHFEMTEVDIDPNPGPDGSHPLWEVTAHPLSVFRCEDNGCAETFTDGAWTAACGDFGAVEPYILKCVCIRKNSDEVVGELGDYCKKSFSGLSVWDLTDWVLPQFVQ